MGVCIDTFEITAVGGRFTEAMRQTCTSVLCAVATLLLCAALLTDASAPSRVVKKPPAIGAKDPFAQHSVALKIFGVFPVARMGFDSTDGGLRAYVNTHHV